jgi:hypothetical protein
LKAKKYWDMNAAQLAATTKEFDEPFVVENTQSLTAADHQRRKRRRGRPKIGQGFQRISVSIEKGLLKKVNAFAKKRRMRPRASWRRHSEESLRRRRAEKNQPRRANAATLAWVTGGRRADRK